MYLNEKVRDECFLIGCFTCTNVKKESVCKEVQVEITNSILIMDLTTYSEIMSLMLYLPTLFRFVK